MCSHALIRIWAERAWWLACANPGCTYRIFESLPSYRIEAPMSKLPRLIEVRLHPELRDALGDTAPQTDEDKAVWPLLDTAYQLVREAAVRAVFVEMRNQAAEQGVTLGTDEELIASSEGVDTLMDLAPDDIRAARTFHAVFEALFNMAMCDAVVGLDMAREDRG